MSERQPFYIGVKGVIRDNANKVLLLKDASKDTWELPGGRIDQTESIEAAFAREISEEIPGARLKRLQSLVYAGLGDFLVENDFKLALLYYAVEVDMPSTITLSAEHTELRWVSRDQIDALNIFKSDKAAVILAF